MWPWRMLKQCGRVREREWDDRWDKNAGVWAEEQSNEEESIGFMSCGRWRRWEWPSGWIRRVHSQADQTTCQWLMAHCCWSHVDSYSASARGQCLRSAKFTTIDALIPYNNKLKWNLYFTSVHCIVWTRIS